MAENEIEIPIKDAPPVAFTVLYKEEFRPLHTFACKCGAKTENVRDIVSESFDKLLQTVKRKGKVFNNKQHLKSYLYTIVKHCTVDFHRTDKRIVNTPDEMLEDQVDENTMEQIERTESLLAYAKQHIDKLPSKQRTIFKLFYLDELSYAEIAARENISTNTVKNQLKSARDRLRSLPDIDNS